MVNGLKQYRSYQVDTAGPEAQVALLYDGARRFTEQALSALEDGRLDDVSLYSGKAQRILEELSFALNPEAGEIAGNLGKLYEYWCWRLGQGLLMQEPAAFREVSATLTEMGEAWAVAAGQVRAQRGKQAHE